MNKSAFPINPWLAEKVQEYRKQNKDSKLRADYDISVQAGSKLSWDQHLTVRALQSALKWDSFLQTIRWKMDLPEEIIFALYRCHVDCVADLVQLSEEEFEECARVQKFETEPVKKYLKKHGYKLLSYNERTFKVQSLLVLPTLTTIEYKTWMLKSPGAEAEFDLNRPLSGDWWVDNCYSRYEYTAEEEKLRSEMQGLKPALTGDLPNDYKEFFTAARTFFECYDKICEDEGIDRLHFLRDHLPEKSKDLATFNNDVLLFMKRDYVRAMVYIFEITGLLKHYTPAQFFKATDEQKLNIAERESANETFQLMLITYVELRIDFENLLWYLQALAGKPASAANYDDMPDPVNPWLGEVIIGFRQRHSNEELRAAYRRYAEHSPHMPWDVFIAEKALNEEMKRNPFLATRRKDMGLPENTTDFLNANSVDTVADLLQITEEEFKEIFEAREDEIPPIRKYLQDHGLHLYHSDKFTWKVGTDEVKEEKDRLKETLDAARQRAKDAIEKEPGLLQERVEKAIEILSAADRMATKYDCDIRAHEQVLRDYAVLLEEHMLAFPYLIKDAPEVAGRLLSMMETIFGADSRQAAGGNRINAAIHAKLENHQMAADYYAAAARVVEKVNGPDALWRGKDLRSSAVCLSRIPDNEKALELFLQAAEVFKKHPNQPHELEETYLNISECYYSLGNKENEQKYRRLAAAIHATGHI